MFGIRPARCIMTLLLCALDVSSQTRAAQVRAEFQMDEPLSGQTNAQRSPAVAFNGTNFLVAWSDDRNSGSTGTDIYAVRVSADGVVLDSAAIPICRAANEQIQPSIAVLA